jgi:hypothetical protein
MAEPNRIAAALEYLGKLRRQIANTQGVAVPDDYGQRFGAPGEPVPSLNQVGQSVRGAAQRMTSLDAPASQGMGDTALDIAAGFTPLQYPQAARDFERSRRTGDKLGMGLATLAAVPVVGGVAKAAGKAREGLEAALDYRMGHRPMTIEGGAARLDNAYEAFGEDIYGPNALRYFGGGDPRESGTVAALKRLRDNPDAEVTIYRGVPSDAKGGITKGDWVTLDRSAAQEYAELKPGRKGKVLAMKVKAKDVTTWPDSLLEFGYYPAD